MLSAPGASGMVTFTGSADTELAPVLNLTYGPQTTSIPEASSVDLEKLLVVYPNPTSNTLFISNRTGKDMTKIEILDMPGKLVYATNSSVVSLDLSNLKPGSYVVRFTTESGQMVVKRIVKR